MMPAASMPFGNGWKFQNVSSVRMDGHYMYKVSRNIQNKIWKALYFFAKETCYYFIVYLTQFFYASYHGKNTVRTT